MDFQDNIEEMKEVLVLKVRETHLLTSNCKIGFGDHSNEEEESKESNR